MTENSPFLPLVEKFFDHDITAAAH